MPTTSTVSSAWKPKSGWVGAGKAKFVPKKGSTGKRRFNFVATNGQVIATSGAL